MYNWKRITDIEIELVWGDFANEKVLLVSLLSYQYKILCTFH